MQPLGQLSASPLGDEHRTLDAALARVAPPAFAWELDALDPALLSRLRTHWRIRLEVEHRSTFVFSQLAQQLAEAGAWLDEQSVMLRMALDELRHTGTCAAVLQALGAPLPPPAAEPPPLARHPGASAEERALRNVLYTTCLSETVACARFVATLDHTTDPMMRAALRTLLADEVLHGRFGYAYLASRRELLAASPALRASIERFLVHAFAVLEGELAPKPPWRPASPLEHAFGLEDPALAHEVFYRTVEHAILPGLEQQGLDAGRAWRERRHLV